MTIKDMHYDFKVKLNKIDSQKYRNLLVPEIDWVLNEAMLLFIDIVTNPRRRSYLGFEKSQKNIDDIKSIVITDEEIAVNSNIVELPEKYLYFVKGKAIIKSENCPEVKARFHVREHDDEFEESPFDRSSYTWRTVNGVFNENGIQLYTDGFFTNEKFLLSYIRQPDYMHNAEDYKTGTYKLPNGEVLTGIRNCELPTTAHRDVVDLAVLIVSGNLDMPNYQLKLSKLNLSGLKN